MKKLFLGALLLLSTLGFSQSSNTRLMIIHSTSNVNGIEVIDNVGKYEIGGGIMASSEKHRLYCIATKKITDEFSIGGKIGGLKDSFSKEKSGFQIYYGLTSYLRLFGKESGMVVSFGFDNTSNCTYGIGYQF